MSGRGNKEKPGVTERISISLNNHSWIKVVSAFLVTIWFAVIIKFLGVTFKLSDTDGNLTVFGWVCTIVVYWVMLAVSLLSVKENKVIKKTESSKRFLEHLLSSLDDLCDANYDRVLAHVTEMGPQISSRDIYKKTVEPQKQLKDICREIKECFA